MRGMELDRNVCYRAILARDARFDGRFFVAVKTTRIYCRPLCGARAPKVENLLFYPTAAAAQAAGFRPCLRCRPESSPGMGAWLGTFSTVARALTLIEAGALDNGDVNALAERLGVGERHLRRLFDQHIGASPIAVAQTRRVLLAKKLIHETALTMTEVAESAGFGSLRRFNETFRNLFGRSPSSLRRGRSNGSGSRVQITLSYRPPYDWDSLSRFFAARAGAGVEIANVDGYARTFEIDGTAGHIEVRPSLERNRFEVAIHVPRVNAIPVVVARLRRVLDLDADPAVIAAHLSEDPALERLVSARPGLRLPGAWDPFELAVRAILGQQVTVGAATQLAGRLIAAFGRRYEESPRPEGLTHLFPTAERLRDADVASIGMPKARGAAISALASAALNDPRLFDSAQDPADAVARLRAIPGIGEWTAQYITMRALHGSDAFPSGDVGLLRALANGGTRPGVHELTARAEAWRPWRAYAVIHLWTGETS
jgi:AraC family transcriptional regulator, regulatory protein of adaptative response / DNA-3-methyladenine glycosylase II